MAPWRPKLAQQHYCKVNFVLICGSPSIIAACPYLCNQCLMEYAWSRKRDRDSGGPHKASHA